MTLSEYMKRQHPFSSDVYDKNLKHRGIDLSHLTMSESAILQMLKDGLKEKRNVTVNSKSRDYKRTDEIHQEFGVDLHETEPFERDLREQEGRRYLLWRKVTG